MDNAGKTRLRSLPLLLVEDDDALRSTMLAIVRPMVTRSLGAENGKHALEIATRLKLQHIVLLITDYQMPLMNGGTLLEEIIKCGIRCDKIILFSALPETDPRIQAVISKNTTVTFFQKPLGIIAMIEFVQDGLPK